MLYKRLSEKDRIQVLEQNHSIHLERFHPDKDCSDLTPYSDIRLIKLLINKAGLSKDISALNQYMIVLNKSLYAGSFYGNYQFAGTLEL